MMETAMVFPHPKEIPVDLRSTQVTVNGVKLKNKHFNLFWATEERAEDESIFKRGTFYFIPVSRKGVKMCRTLFSGFTRDSWIAVDKDVFTPMLIKINRDEVVTDWPKEICVTVESLMERPNADHH